MGRASQIFWFLNAETMPSEDDILNKYTHVFVNRELRKLRLEYRRNLKKELKENQEDKKDDQERLF